MFFEGVELADLCAVYPEGIGEVPDGLYADAVQKVFEWFTKEYFEDKRVEYIFDADPKKRFLKRVWRYILRIDATEAGEGVVSVRMSARLEGPQGEVACNFCDAQVWDTRSQSMLDPLYAISVIMPDRLGYAKKKKPDAVFFEDGEAWLLKNGEWEKI